MPEPTYNLPSLPPPGDFETPEILRLVVEANRHLAELKGRAASIPNQGILIDMLVLQEARASSEIENIITTQDELFRADFFSQDPSEDPPSPAAKEVMRYRDALKRGYDFMLNVDGIIKNSAIIEMYQMLKGNTGGFRTTPGTKIMNVSSGEIVYVPPQDARVVDAQMAALECFINEDYICDLDPLVKMALIHHQFESIHPFPDGNGRIGRILCVLYLVHSGLLDIPILYLSRAIIQSKGEYYRRLQAVRDQGDWNAWILYMLQAVSRTARVSLAMVESIRELMDVYKEHIRKELPKIYSLDLVNNLFQHPYTRAEFVRKDLGVSRQTATRYLEALVGAGLVEKETRGRNNYYVNMPLVRIFLSAGEKG